MGETATPVHDCPSCGSALPSGSPRCPACGALIGRCSACQALGVAGTDCLECERGKVTAPRPTVRAKSKKDAVSGDVPYAFRGGVNGLYPLLAVRLAAFAGFLGGALLAARHAGVEALDPVTAAFDPGLSWPAAAGVAAGSLLLLAGVGTFVRRYRMHRTFVYGARVAYRPGGFGLAANGVLNLAFLALTAGLALPWIIARNRRSFYRGCVVPDHANRALDFKASGDEMFGYSLLTLLLFPLVLGTAGLLRPLVSWIWVRWEQRHLLLPGPFGKMQPVAFTGTFGGYAPRAFVWWVASLGTLGLLRPWALGREWAWIAAHTGVRT